MKLGERIKPVRVPTRNVGEIQLPSAMTRMSQVGIPLFEPSDDQMRRWLDKVKESIAVPESDPAPEGVSGAPPAREREGMIL